MTSRYNEKIIQMLEDVSSIYLNKKEPFRAKAYQKAQETIIAINEDITDYRYLVGKPNMGTAVLDKCRELFETGTLDIIEKEKLNPVNIFRDIYGIGPVKASQLVDVGITTIEQLRANSELLNDVQKVGLKYYEYILERIPRQEIMLYEKIFTKIIGSRFSFQIVGSYRRGALHSGDIDVILTCSESEYNKFIDILIQHKIIVEVLSRGQTKTLVITQLNNVIKQNQINQINTTNKYRRVDFLCTDRNEYAFALLYFTGSKIFNMAMRQHAIHMGYTFNEHGMHHLVDGKKGKQVEHTFLHESDIFDFLKLTYKEPENRRDIRDISIVPKTYIDLFKKDGVSMLSHLTEQNITSIIEYASDAYFNHTPVISDNQFDIIKEYAETKFNKKTPVGAKVERNKETLPFEMPSMDKIKPDTNALKTWMQKYTGPYVISCKLDGVSGLYTKTTIKDKDKDNTDKDNKTVKTLHTRGDGIVGQKMDYLIPYMNIGVSDKSNIDIAVRGEFIISKKLFTDVYSDTFANPRNMVAGTINNKHISPAIYDLDFVAYELIQPECKPSEQLERLQAMNMKTVYYVKTDTISNEMLSQMLIELRAKYEYEIDGLIVTDDKIYKRKSGNPEHSFAFKMVLTEQMAEAKVVDVLWNPSKDGYLKPRVQIEPIDLCGVRIEYATGFNGAFIRDNNIGVGAMITIIRSGDVIPHIVNVIEPTTAKMPSVEYKWNDTNIDIMLVDMDNEIVKEKNITMFFKGLEVDGLSSGNVSRLIRAGYDSVAKIIKMSENDFLQVDGFKEKMANKLYNGIRDKIEKANMVTIMSSSNIFGRGFSDKKIELICSQLPDILTTKSASQIAELKGMSIKTGEAFVEKIDDFIRFVQECGLEYKLTNDIKEKKEKIDITNPLFGKTIVLSGTRNKTIMEFITHMGGVIGSSVSKKTHMVISSDETSGKTLDAKRLGINIMTPEQFIIKYNL